MSTRARYVAGVLGRLLMEEARRSRRGGGADTGEKARVHARTVREALQSLGPFYIKAGQMLSTRPDFVPPAMIEEFDLLHDQVTPAPFEVFEPVLAQDLGARWPRMFREIDTDTPLGAASLAQVYGAVLADGTPAAVKIQRPGVEQVMAQDMAVLRRTARLIARAAPRFTAVIDLPAMLGVLFDAMEGECDFRKEAAHMRTAGRLTEDFKHVTVPLVLLDPTRRVLVQSLAPGTSVHAADPREFTADERTGIGRDLMAFMFRGFFLDRYFHADPHPGNIFVAPGHPAHLIDWGMVGRVEANVSRSLVLALLNVAANDGTGLAKTWTEMGHPTPWADLAGFRTDVAALVPKVTSASLEELNFGVTLTAVLTHATRRGIQSSPVIALLGKSFANLEGSVRHLCPELSITDVFEENLRTIMFGLAQETLSEQQAARTALELMIAAPGSLQQGREILRNLANHAPTAPTAANGTASARTRSPADTHHTRAALILAAAIIWSSRRRQP
ncbi:AarF/UbiB family protein [Streptomyces sp. BE308]|uniref:ABC1 kinase family protein n=1 Tax=Streptomyces sp. BE308 TaxID=3002529 RepID=UPI002E795D16|nr:AarF/UbiB family protein [Streptomyces sp. BE308]MEE1792288.1 AarF/UbiB family protein [Streptomyces sp. BE308]